MVSFEILIGVDIRENTSSVIRLNLLIWIWSCSKRALAQSKAVPITTPVSCFSDFWPLIFSDWTLSISCMNRRCRLWFYKLLSCIRIFISFWKYSSRDLKSPWFIYCTFDWTKPKKSELLFPTGFPFVIVQRAVQTTSFHSCSCSQLKRKKRWNLKLVLLKS